MFTIAKVSEMGSSRFVISLDQPPGVSIILVSENENLRLGISPLSVAGGTSMSGFSISRLRFRGPKSSAPQPSERMGSGLLGFLIDPVFLAIFLLTFYPYKSPS